MSAIQRKMRTTSSTGAALVSELWRGYVVEVFGDNTAQVVVPRLAGDDPIGRIPSLVPDLAVGARVIVGAIEGRIEDLVVLSAVSSDGLVIGDARFTDVLLDNAPTDPNHATRKDYVDAQIATRAATVHTHDYSSLTGIPASFTPSAHAHAYSSLTGIPASFTPSAHTHDTSDLTSGILADVRLPPRLRGFAEHLNNSRGNDWNNARENGWYMSDAALNAPAAGWHLGYVEAHNDIYVTQTVHSFTSDSASNVQVWRRDVQAGSWSSWYKLQLSQSEQDARYAALTHLHSAAQISDSTATGRSLLTAVDAAAARAAIGAGTSSLVLGTGAGNAKAGNWVPSFAEVTGTVSTAQLPPLAINDTFPVATQAAMLALTAQRGDMAIRSDNGRTYVLSSDSPATLADWKEIMAAGQVQSVAGKTGVVLLVKADVGLSNVDNTSDLLKPISTATQTALNGKSDTAHTHAAATSGAAGFMAAADKTLLDAATSAATASAIVKRDAAGRAQFAAPSAAADAATKSYVDAKQTLVGRMEETTLSTGLTNLIYLINEITVNVIAGHRYKMTAGMSWYGTSTGDVALNFCFRQGGANGSNSGTVFRERTIWSAPMANSGIGHSQFGSYVATATGPLRFSFTVERQVTSSPYNVSGREIIIEDMGVDV